MTRIGHSSLSHRLYHHITCGLVLWIVPVNSVVMFQQFPLDLHIGTWMIRLSDQTSHPGPPRTAAVTLCSTEANHNTKPNHLRRPTICGLDTPREANATGWVGWENQKLIAFWLRSLSQNPFSHSYLKMKLVHPSLPNSKQVIHLGR